MNLPEPVAWMYDFTITGEDEVYTNWVTQDPTEVGKEVEGIRNVRTLYSEAQLREALASNEAVMRQALELLGPQAPECCGCATEWNEAIKALEEQLK